MSTGASPEAESKTRRPLPRGAIGNLFRGAWYPFEAFSFMRQHGLRRLAAVPVLINALLLVLLVAGTVVLVSHHFGRVDSWLAGMHGGRLGAVLVTALAWVARVLLILLTVSLDITLLILVGRVVASPFLDMLSERVEEVVAGRTPPPMSAGRALRSIGMALRDAVAALLHWLALNVLVVALAFLPVVGPLAAVATWLVTARLLADELVDLPLARRLVPYRNRRRALRGNGAAMLGFGLSSVLLLLIPLVDLFLLPAATVGGTLLFCDLEAAGRIRAE